MAAVMIMAALPALAQQDEGPILRPKPQPKPAPSTTLLVMCDLACDWKLDGEAKGRIDAGGSVKAKVMPGQHMVASALGHAYLLIEDVGYASTGRTALIEFDPQVSL